MGNYQHIFITGGTTGLGLELAKQYLKEGARVGVCGRNIAKLPEGIEAEFPKLKAYQCDVTEAQKLRECIEDFSKEGLDLVVANAGISVATKSDRPNFEDGRRVMDINVMGVLNTFDPALDYMIERKSGQIAAISSVAGFAGLPGASFYCASKAAVTTLCETYAIDLKKFGIGVTCICPGFIVTPLTDKNTHAMPFKLSLVEGVKRIKSALDKKKELYLFPWRMKFVIILLNKMPRRLYRWLIKTSLMDYKSRKN